MTIGMIVKQTVSNEIVTSCSTIFLHFKPQIQLRLLLLVEQPTLDDAIHLGDFIKHLQARLPYSAAHRVTLWAGYGEDRSEMHTPY